MGSLRGSCLGLRSRNLVSKMERVDRRLWRAVAQVELWTLGVQPVLALEMLEMALVVLLILELHFSQL